MRSRTLNTKDRRVQTPDGAESPGQFHCIPNRSVDDPQPDPRDILPVLRLRFPGKEKVVAIDHGDREIVRPLFPRAKAQAKVLRLVKHSVGRPFEGAGDAGGDGAQQAARFLDFLRARSNNCYHF